MEELSYKTWSLVFPSAARLHASTHPRAMSLSTVCAKPLSTLCKYFSEDYRKIESTVESSEEPSELSNPSCEEPPKRDWLKEARFSSMALSACLILYSTFIITLYAIVTEKSSRLSVEVKVVSLLTVGFSVVYQVALLVIARFVPTHYFPKVFTVATQMAVVTGHCGFLSLHHLTYNKVRDSNLHAPTVIALEYFILIVPIIVPFWFIKPNATVSGAEDIKGSQNKPKLVVTNYKGLGIISFAVGFIKWCLCELLILSIFSEVICLSIVTTSSIVSTILVYAFVLVEQHQGEGVYLPFFLLNLANGISLIIPSLVTIVLLGRLDGDTL